MLDFSNTKRIKRRMVAIISLMLILVTAISFSVPEALAAAKNDDVKTEEKADSGTGEKTEKESEKKAEEKSGNGLDAEKDAPVQIKKDSAGRPIVSSSSYTVISGSTGEVVVSKHAERKMQPGRIAMLVTAMVVIDNLYDEEELNNTVDIDSKLAGYGNTFRQGESVSVGDLLTAMLVGGDVQSAEALLSYSASKRKIFIREMNSRCMALGLMDTIFKNPGGNYDEKQYSTASDLAVITQAAFTYRRIRDTLAMKSASVTAYEKKTKRKVEIKSCDPLIAGESSQLYKYAQGGISGSAGYPVYSTQMAAASVKDDMQLIVILMDSNEKSAAAEAKALTEYADTKVTRNTIVKKDKLVGHVRIKGGASTRVGAYTETKGFAYVPPEGSEELVETRIVLFDGLKAPMKKGDKVGEFRIYVADELKGTVDLVIKKDIPAGWPPSKIYISNSSVIALCVIIALLAAFLLRVRSVKRRRAKHREAMRRKKIRELALKQMQIDEDRRKRNWSGQGYSPMPPRTSDIRKESAEEPQKGSGKPKDGGRK